MENPIEMDDLGGFPIFLETPNWLCTRFIHLVENPSLNFTSSKITCHVQPTMAMRKCSTFGDTVDASEIWLTTVWMYKNW